MGKLKLYLSSNSRRRSMQVLLGLTLFLLADTVFQTGMHVWWRVWISNHTSALKAAEAATSQPARKEKAPKPPELAAELKKRNIFTAPKPSGHGLTLTGVIFDRAMFNRREGGPVTLKEGESAGPVKLKSINGYEVVIEYEGKPQTIKLFSDQGGGPGQPPGMRGPPGGPGPVMASPSGMPAEIRMPAGMDMSNLPPEVRERIQSRMNRRPK